MRKFTPNPRRPGRATRSLMRLPVPIFRRRGDAIFRGRLLLLRHRGRHSGRMHETVLEVALDRGSEIVVISAWGRRSDWYRNVEVAGAQEIVLRGRRHSHPRHRLLEDDEVVNVVREYRREHPLTARVAEAAFGWPFSGPDDALHELARATGGVAFTLGVD